MPRFWDVHLASAIGSLERLRRRGRRQAEDLPLLLLADVRIDQPRVAILFELQQLIAGFLVESFPGPSR